MLIVGCYLATVTTATATVAARTLQRQNVKGASCGIGAASASNRSDPVRGSLVKIRQL